MTTTVAITDSDLNTMNQVLFGMRRLKSRQQRPVFSIADITDEWHIEVDPLTSTEEITAILEAGASTGFFLFYQCENGTLFYGYNANMLRFNPKNKSILLAAPRGERACLDSCNVRINPVCIYKDPTPSNCCYTQWKGTVSGGTIGQNCGVSMDTALFMCTGQQTRFCN
jgi:hypothetical protein